MRPWRELLGGIALLKECRGLNLVDPAINIQPLRGCNPRHCYLRRSESLPILGGRNKCFDHLSGHEVSIEGIQLV